MPFTYVFKRYESKYILSKEQKERVLSLISPYMSIDKYGRTTIRNLYFDTDNYRLIRHSIEKPEYKEKLRIRSYERVNSDSTVFVEIKKKYRGVVYKRRVSTTEKDAMAWLLGERDAPEKSQISEEIDYFISFYKTLSPKAFLSYEREAYYALSGEDFRITFDENILCREDGLSLTNEVSGMPILDDGLVLMEIKSAGAIPLWMTEILSRERIYKTPFSKYGTAYKKLIFPRLIETRRKPIEKESLISI